MCVFLLFTRHFFCVVVDVATTTEHFALQVPPIDLGSLAADFILKLLAEQKLPLVNIKYVMDAGTQLANNAVNNKLQEAIRLIVNNNLDPLSALSSILLCKETPFAQLRHQSSQNQYFVKHFG